MRNAVYKYVFFHLHAVMLPTNPPGCISKGFIFQLITFDA